MNEAITINAIMLKTTAEALASNILDIFWLTLGKLRDLHRTPSKRPGRQPAKFFLRTQSEMDSVKGCLVQVGNGIELEAVGFRFEPYRWRRCGMTWDSSRTVVVFKLKLRRTSTLSIFDDRKFSSGNQGIVVRPFPSEPAETTQAWCVLPPSTTPYAIENSPSTTSTLLIHLYCLL